MGQGLKKKGHGNGEMEKWKKQSAAAVEKLIASLKLLALTAKCARQMQFAVCSLQFCGQRSAAALSKQIAGANSQTKGNRGSQLQASQPCICVSHILFRPPDRQSTRGQADGDARNDGSKEEAIRRPQGPIANAEICERECSEIEKLSNCQIL